MNEREMSAYIDELTKIKHKCSCGHSVIMPHWVDKQICNWCGSYVFKDKKVEFNYRIKEKLKKKEMC